MESVGGAILALQSSEVMDPYADGFQYQVSYQEQGNPGSSLITFRLGHLFNENVIAEVSKLFQVRCTAFK